MALSAIASIAGPALGIAGNLIGGKKQADQSAQAATISREQLEVVLDQLARNNEIRDFLLQDALAQRGIDRDTALATRETPESITTFDPERGFVTELKELPSAVFNAVLRRQLTDLSNQRFNDQQLASIAQQRRRFRGAADDQLQELQGGRPITDELISGLLARQARIGVDDAFRDSGNIAASQFARTGGADSLAAGRVFDNLARSKSTALEQALVNARLQGINTAFNQEQTRKQNAATNAFNLGNIGQQLLPIPGVTTNIGRDASSTQGNIAGNALQAGGLDVSRLGLAANPINPTGVVEGGRVASDATAAETSGLSSILGNIGDLVDLGAGFFDKSPTAKATTTATSTPRLLRNTFGAGGGNVL